MILADVVADTVLEMYRKLFKSKGKAIENCNSWTVLSAILVLNHTTNDLTCLSLATGTECLSKRRRDNGGILLVDSHAEILSHRALKRCILNEMVRLVEDNAYATSSYLTLNPAGTKFQLRKGFEFILYTSHVPCGDCSVVASKEAIRNFPSDISCNDNSAISSINVLRGRSFSDRSGRLRTKPGRADAEESESHSCSDKISRWVCLGLGGSFVNYHMETPIRLSILVVGDDFNHESLQRGINGRTYSWRRAHSIEPLEIYSTSRSFEYGRTGDKVSSSISSIWYLGCEKIEILNLGRRQGFIIPRNKESWSPKASSSVSKLNIGILFMKTISSTLPPHPVTYRDLKSMCKDYQERKKNLLSDDCAFIGWKQSSHEFEKFSYMQPTIQK